MLVALFDPTRLNDYVRLARDIRRAGIGVELYPEARKLGQQLKYADQRGFRIALIAGSQEFAQGTCQVKNLATGESQSCPLDENAAAIVAVIRQMLSP